MPAHPSTPTRRRRRLAARLTALAAVGLSATGLVAGSGTGASAATTAPGIGAAVRGALDVDLLGRTSLGDLDTRTGSVAPSAAQVTAAQALGATTRWNRYGTPASMLKDDGPLATGLTGTPVQQARAFVRAQRVLFGLSTTDVSALEVLKDTALTGTESHVVMFRQRFGDLPAGEDGLITVGLLPGGQVAYVSSSAVGSQTAPAAPTLTALQAWQQAAASVGRVVALPDLTGARVTNGWTSFAAKGFAQPQLARLVALPVPGAAPRAAFEVDVVDVHDGLTTAFIAFVDARSGKVLVRRDAVDHADDTTGFTGDYGTVDGCGPQHPVDVAADTQSLLVTAGTVVPTNDIILKVFRPDGSTAAAGDVGTSPEAVTLATGGVAGVWTVQVCGFGDTSVSPAQSAPFTYVGQVTQSSQALPSGGGVPYPPKWSYFHNFPTTYSSDDTRATDCWVNATGNPRAAVPGCEGSEQLQNTAARAPWDVDPRTQQPTFTTAGNAALTAQAWGSPLTPAEQLRPVSPTREYTKAAMPWTDQWRTSACDPTSFASPSRNDVDASIVNLFSGHNRIHDFAYYLGFTEENYNAQQSNFGNNGSGGTVPNNGEGDPEIGNVQAGAVTGGSPSYLGRDNANQITLQDGVPPITNQYLFQPIGGAFYSPCVDGDLDSTVFGHEYTHLISGRMVGGPDDGLTGAQAGAMNESWSDQVAMEYLNETGYFTEPGRTQDNPFVVGHYVTGNPDTGIRDYALDANPLNYSDMGFDLTGPEVHADGEIWNAVGTDLRLAMTQKYASQFPTGGALKSVNAACADGKRAPQDCPGNRRWLQIQFDAYLLQQGSTSMLDARDAYLAADRMRFGGANQDVLWHVFASRGLGRGAQTNGTDDTDPKPGWDSPKEAEGTVAVAAKDATTGAAVPATFYVGDYSARATPVADTDPATPLPSRLSMVPGTYRFVAVAPGYGTTRFVKTVKAGQRTNLVLQAQPNWAAGARGATASGEGGNFTDLIDEDEGTDYASVGRAADVDTAKAHPTITVDLAGDAPVAVRSVRVSALLHAADAGDDYDTGSQNRFTALRKFAVQTCTASTANAGCTLPSGFTTVFTSADDAFPGTLPRPVAPDLTLRSFDVQDSTATHLRLVVLENQCTGTPAYAGQQDNDPLNETDCRTPQSISTSPGGLSPARSVRVAELQAFPVD